jgi:hypothetical protein
MAEGRGPSVSLVSTQVGTDPGGWIVDLYACFDDKFETRAFCATLVLSAVDPATKRPTRLLAVASIPGSRTWYAHVRSPAPAPTTPLQFALFAGEIALTTAGVTPVDL